VVDLLHVNGVDYNVIAACGQEGPTTEGMSDNHILSGTSKNVRVSGKWMALVGDSGDNWEIHTTAQRVLPLST
jgi:hypothetical protein